MQTYLPRSTRRARAGALFLMAAAVALTAPTVHAQSEPVVKPTIRLDPAEPTDPVETSGGTTTPDLYGKARNLGVNRYQPYRPGGGGIALRFEISQAERQDHAECVLMVGWNVKMNYALERHPQTGCSVGLGPNGIGIGDAVFNALLPSSSYRFVVLIRYVSRGWVSSDPFNFTTAPPVAGIEKLTASSPAAGVVDLWWTPVAGASYYDVKEVRGTSSVYSGPSLVGVGGDYVDVDGRRVYRIRGLLPGSTYKYEVRPMSSDRMAGPIFPASQVEATVAR